MRAFFAIELSDTTRAAAAAAVAELQRRLGDAGGELRFVAAEALHVTARFLGEIERGAVGDICRAVGDELARQSPFELRLGALQAFPPKRNPRVAILGVEPEGVIVAFAAAVERGAQAAGFEPESRPFRAHLTLARTRSNRSALPELPNDIVVEPAPMQVDHLVLYESDLAPGGARHTVLERLPLGQG